MMSALEESLQRIDTWIEQNNSFMAQNLRSNLQPGLTIQDIDQKLSDLSIVSEVDNSETMKLSREVYELYQWHNGEAEVAESVRLESLETSISMRSLYDPAGFFPIFSAEYYFCGVAGSQYQEDISPILYYCFEDGVNNRSTSVVSPSLTNLMTAVAECLETVGGISACTMALHSQGDIPSEEFFPNVFGMLTQENMKKLSPIYEKYQVDYLNVFR
jgi:hypothetical protein